MLLGQFKYLWRDNMAKLSDNTKDDTNLQTSRPYKKDGRWEFCIHLQNVLGWSTWRKPHSTVPDHKTHHTDVSIPFQRGNSSNFDCYLLCFYYNLRSLQWSLRSVHYRSRTKIRRSLCHLIHRLLPIRFLNIWKRKTGYRDPVYYEILTKLSEFVLVPKPLSGFW